MKQNKHFTWNKTSHFTWNKTSHFNWNKTSHFTWNKTSHFTWNKTSHFICKKTIHFICNKTSHFIQNKTSHFQWNKTSTLSETFCSIWSGTTLFAQACLSDQIYPTHKSSLICPWHIFCLVQPLEVPLQCLIKSTRGASDEYFFGWGLIMVGTPFLSRWLVGCVGV